MPVRKVHPLQRVDFEGQRSVGRGLHAPTSCHRGPRLPVAPRFRDRRQRRADRAGQVALSRPVREYGRSDHHSAGRRRGGQKGRAWRPSVRAGGPRGGQNRQRREVLRDLAEWNHAFDPRPWDEAKLKPQLDDLAATEWKTFTDNFLCLYAANNWKMGWFNDEQWKSITANLRLSARAAKTGRCVGIVFDPEPYGDNPWAYAGKNKDHSFAEVEAQVRKRGVQFMTALQTELPEVRLLTFFHQSLFDELLARPDLQDRQLRLSRQPWALLSAFWNGALEVAAPGVRIIDGYELAYYYTAREPFSQGAYSMADGPKPGQEKVKGKGAVLDLSVFH